jgi:uncharacterized membrane protein
MVYNYPSSTTPDWISDMWSHMGGGMMGGTNDPYLGYFGILFTILIVLVLASVGALIYFIVFPELKIGQTRIQINNIDTSKKSEAIESIRKTLNDDEKKILEVLEYHNGTYLQKYLGKEAGLTRLKTHRILTRFAERRLITLEKKGNTNEVKLKDWLKV